MQTSFLRDRHSTQTTQTSFLKEKLSMQTSFLGKSTLRKLRKPVQNSFLRDSHSTQTTQTCANLIFKGKALYANYANQANLIFKGKALYADYANLIFKG